MTALVDLKIIEPHCGSGLNSMESVQEKEDEEVETSMTPSSFDESDSSIYLTELPVSEPLVPLEPLNFIHTKIGKVVIIFTLSFIFLPYIIVNVT